MKLNYIYTGNCLDVMVREIPDSSVDMVLTSPPYDGIRDYDKDWDIDLPALGKEVSRVLKPGGVCVMVMQDQTKLVKSTSTFRTIVDWVDSTELNLWECLIYRRSGTPGAWWSKRFRVDHEYMPIFIKGMRPQFFDKEHMKIPTNYAGETSFGSMSTRATDGTLIKGKSKEKSFTVADTKCPGTVIDYTKDSKMESRNSVKKEHPATFPDKLANDMIQAFTKPGMVVMDPMCGSGTTVVQAKSLGRSFIGIDINPEYVDLTKRRLSQLPTTEVVGLQLTTTTNGP